MVLSQKIVCFLSEQYYDPPGWKIKYASRRERVKNYDSLSDKNAQAMYVVVILDKVNDHEAKMEWFHISLSCFEYEFEWRVQYNGTSLSYFVITVRKKLIKGNHSQISDFKKSDKSV